MRLPRAGPRLDLAAWTGRWAVADGKDRKTSVAYEFIGPKVTRESDTVDRIRSLLYASASVPPRMRNPVRRLLSVHLMAGLCNQLYEFVAAALVAARTGRVLLAPEMLVRRIATDDACSRNAWSRARREGYAKPMSHLVDTEHLHAVLARLGVLFVETRDGDGSGAAEDADDVDTDDADTNAAESTEIECQVITPRFGKSSTIATDYASESPHLLLHSPFCTIAVDRPDDCDFQTQVLGALVPAARLSQLVDGVCRALAHCARGARDRYTDDGALPAQGQRSSPVGGGPIDANLENAGQLWAVHARLEADWPDPHLGVRALADLVRKRADGRVRVVYVVGAVPRDCADKLAEYAPEIRWVTKDTAGVFGDALCRRLRALAFEEAAVVDRAVASSATVHTFVGLDNSSLSQTVAVERNARDRAFSMYTVPGGGTMGCDRGLLFARHLPMNTRMPERALPDFETLVAHVGQVPAVVAAAVQPVTAAPVGVAGTGSGQVADEATVVVVAATTATATVTSIVAENLKPLPQVLFVVGAAPKGDGSGDGRDEDEPTDDDGDDQDHVATGVGQRASEAALLEKQVPVSAGVTARSRISARLVVPEWMSQATWGGRVHLHAVIHATDRKRVEIAAERVDATTIHTVASGDRRLASVAAIKRRLRDTALHFAIDQDTDAPSESRIAMLEHLFPQLAPDACYAVQLSAADARHGLGAGDGGGWGAKVEQTTTVSRSAIVGFAIDTMRRLQTRVVDAKALRPSALSDMLASIAVLESFVVFRKKGVSATAATAATSASASLSLSPETKHEDATTTGGGGGGGGGGGDNDGDEKTERKSEDEEKKEAVAVAVAPLPLPLPVATEDSVGYPQDLAPGELPQLDNRDGRWWPRDAPLLFLVHQYDGKVEWTRQLKHAHRLFEKHKPPPAEQRAATPFVAPNIAKAETNLLQFCAVFYDDLPPLVGQVYQYEHKHVHRGSLVDLCNRPGLVDEVRNNTRTPGYASLNCIDMGDARSQHAKMGASGWWRACMAPYFGVPDAQTPAAIGNWTAGKRASAQFVVSRERIRSLPRAFYANMFAWLVKHGTGEATPMAPDSGGNRPGSQREHADMRSHFWTSRYLEWTWELIFTSVKRHEICSLAHVLPSFPSLSSSSSSSPAAASSSLPEDTLFSPALPLPLSTDGKVSSETESSQSPAQPRVTILYGSRYFMRDCTRAALALGWWNPKTWRLTVPADCNFNAAFGDGHHDTAKHLRIYDGGGCGSDGRGTDGVSGGHDYWSLGESSSRGRLTLVFSRTTGRVRRTHSA